MPDSSEHVGKRTGLKYDAQHCLLYSKNITALPEKRREICCGNLELRGAEVLYSEILVFKKRLKWSGFAVFAVVDRALPAGLLLISSSGKQGGSLNENLYQKCVSSASGF